MAKKRVAWDSSVIIDAIEESAPWWAEVEPMYNDAVAGKLEIVVSEISIAEVCRIERSTAKGVSKSVAIAELLKFFNNPFILRRPADRRESELAAQIIRDHNLETCDALIVATAVVTQGVVALYTRDGLKKRKKKKPSPLRIDGKIGSPPLSILVPNAAQYLNSPLFANRTGGAEV